MDDTRRRAMVAKIKIAQKELDMDDDTYRAVLLRVTGKNSSTRLDAAELDAVLREMCRLGFVPRPAAYVRPPLPQNRRAVGAGGQNVGICGRHRPPDVRRGIGAGVRCGANPQGARRAQRPHPPRKRTPCVILTYRPNSLPTLPTCCRRALSP